MFGGEDSRLRLPVRLPSEAVAGSPDATLLLPAPAATTVGGSSAGRAAAGAPGFAAARARSRYQRLVVVLDLLAAVLGVCAGFWERFGDNLDVVTSKHVVLAILLPVAWLCCAALNRAYEPRFLGAGAFEFQRVGRAFLHLVAVTAFTAFVSGSDLSREFVLVALPLIFVFSVGARYAARRVLHRQRAAGRSVTPVLVIGGAGEVACFSDTLVLQSHVGLRVAAACVPPAQAVSEEEDAALRERGIQRIGDIDSIRDAVARSGAGAVAVISPRITGERLQWIAWQLEGTDTDLIVQPGLTEIAGRRLSIQQVGELPLLYVAEPEFRGVRRVVKAAFDRGAAALALMALAPLLLCIALVVRLTSRGPALFLQTRVGKDGRTFRMVKFRSMCVDAEARLVEIEKGNEVIGGTLFKLRQDPRVTPVGRLLRRYSLDELPQLFNVLSGSMSLVGPRPPLPREVATYGGHVHRRLLVKPGLTGLWQISGRSDLSWEESVRLDLRYVENWSLGLDMVVLLKTASAVIRSKGAY